MRKFQALIKASFLEGLVLRNRIPIIIIEQLLTISVNYYIWKQVSLTNLQIEYSPLKISTYPIIVWVLQLFINSSVFLKMMQQYRTGQIVTEIVRPVSYFELLFCSSFGKSLFKLIFGCLPTVFLVLLGTELYIPASIVSVIMFIISIIFSAILLAEIDYCLGRLIFITESGTGLFMFRCLLIDIFSGILFPLEYSPVFLKQVINLLPIRFIYYAPTSIFLEIFSIEDSMRMLIQQLLWIVVGSFLVKFVTKVTKSHLQVQGG